MTNFFYMDIDKFRKLSTNLNKSVFASHILKTNRYNYYRWQSNHVILKEQGGKIYLGRVVKSAIHDNFKNTDCNFIRLTKLSSFLTKDTTRVLSALYDVNKISVLGYAKDLYYITPCLSLISLVEEIDVQDCFRYLAPNEYYCEFSYSEIILKSLKLI